MSDETPVTTLEELVGIIGEPTARAAAKVRDRLDEDDRRWLAAARLCFVATSDGEGHLDVSPKGDPAGSLVHVLDDTTIALAERPGNRRVDGYRNILTHPRAGIVFVVPGRSDTLRVNGSARLVADAPWFDDLAVEGHRPVLALVLDVEEVFGHCAKSFARGKVWHPETWDPFAATDVGSTARARRAAGEPEPPQPTTAEELEDRQLASYGVPLY